MAEPDFVSYMISFIKDYDYPLVHSMSSEEIAEVFHLSNRCFLVTWAFILLDGNCYGEILKGREQDICLLADLLYCHGFCSDSEKLGFLNGSVSIDDQVKILYKMFNFIECQKKADKLVAVEPVTLDEIHALRNTNLNIFPGFGDIKALSEEERLNKMKEIQVKIETLTSECEKLKELSNLPKVSEIKKECIKDVINDIKENLSQFERVVKVLGREASSKVEPNYKISPKSSKLLESCNEYLRIVTQYIEDLNTINQFVIEDIQMPFNEVSPLVEILAEQIQSMNLNMGL